MVTLNLDKQLDNFTSENGRNYQKSKSRAGKMVKMVFFETEISEIDFTENLREKS